MPHTIIKLLLLVAGVTLCVTQDTQDVRESRVVQTAQGLVRGYKEDDIFYFYGIPYATAPTGTRRFTAPLPGPVWMNPLEAVNNMIICPQGSSPDYLMLRISRQDMREDCLVANIYMPDTEETNLPVVVYVHGGGYQLGFGHFGDPSPLVRTKKVIAVTFNYRLGVHGFLCLGTENAPGNAGMKDQVALLRWVQKNIANFGGNPNEVTIAGYSAGSSAVDLLMLSEMTKGLYNKVIPESGASVAVWSVVLDPIQNAKDFAKQLNFTNVDNINSLEEFYSTLSYEDLTSDIFFTTEDSNSMFTPCIERDTGVEKFLDDAPVNILTQGKYRKVPVLYGFANMEGLFRVPWFELWQESMNERFSDFLPVDLHFENNEEKENIAKVIKEFYFSEKHVSSETIQGYIDYFSDVLFTFSHLRSVKLQVEAGSDSIYLYEYSFFTPHPEFFPEYVKNITGATHTAQTYAVLEFEDVGPDSDEYKRMKNIMVELWVNFITTGKPVPEGSDLPSWPPVGANRSPYMSLGEEISLNGGPLLEERTLLWEDIYGRFYRSPAAPSSAKTLKETLTQYLLLSFCILNVILT
ncbi:esterase E4-like [Cydia splendana]|uniref:esterase E4-like n=1 Tax=Cydia splendana TaxID=1100963 RepID=UPI00300C3077